jgi:hypothetical protein
MIVVRKPLVKMGSQFLGAFVDRFAECDLIEVPLDGLMESFAITACLRRGRLGARVVDFGHGPVRRIIVLFRFPTRSGAVISVRTGTTDTSCSAKEGRARSFDSSVGLIDGYGG